MAAKALTPQENTPLLPHRRRPETPSRLHNLPATDRNSSSSSSAHSDSASSSKYTFLEEDCSPSYSFLILSHVLGLLPSVAFLLVFAFLALHVPCRLPLVGATGADEIETASRARFSALLGPRPWLGWSLFLLAVVSYAAAHKVRNLITRLCSLVLRIIRVFFLETSNPLENHYDIFAKDNDDAATTIFSFLSKALFTEAFKIMLIVVASAIVLGQTYVEKLGLSAAPRHLGPNSNSFTEQKSIVESFKLANLYPTDGRFSFVVWLICGCE